MTLTFLQFVMHHNSVCKSILLITDRVSGEGNAIGRVCPAVFTARGYASAVLAMGLCLSVSVSVCLSVTSRSST